MGSQAHSEVSPLDNWEKPACKHYSGIIYNPQNLEITQCSSLGG